MLNNLKRKIVKSMIVAVVSIANLICTKIYVIEKGMNDTRETARDGYFSSNQASSRRRNWSRGGTDSSNYNTPQSCSCHRGGIPFSLSTSPQLTASHPFASQIYILFPTNILLFIVALISSRLSCLVYMYILS